MFCFVFKGDYIFESEGCEASSSKEKCTINHSHPKHSICEMIIDIEYHRLCQLYIDNKSSLNNIKVLHINLLETLQAESYTEEEMPIYWRKWSTFKDSIVKRKKISSHLIMNLSISAIKLKQINILMEIN